VPRKKTSTLEPLLQLREEQVDTRARKLQQRVALTERMREAHEQEQQAQQQHEQKTQQRVREEGARADVGDASLQDLSMLHAWQVVQRQRAQALAARVARANDAFCAAEREQARATGELADARAAARVVEQHRDRMIAAERRAQELQAEEDAGDDASARFVRRRG
jgi:hypothetical protein